MSCNCIDYPVSWTFWRAHCIEVHGFDPGDNEYQEKEQPNQERQKRSDTRVSKSREDIRPKLYGGVNL